MTPLRFLLPLALLLRLVLRTLRGFLAAIGLTVHVSAYLSSRKAGRDEQYPHFYRYGHRRSMSQGGDNCLFLDKCFDLIVEVGVEHPPMVLHGLLIHHVEQSAEPLLSLFVNGFGE